jgi:glutamyl-tRNA(Gln) amidotransferase subunit D
MPKLMIIYTGGTIGGKHDSEGKIKVDFKRKKFINLLYTKYPSLRRDLKRENVELYYESPIREFSENIIPSDWTKIAKTADSAIKKKIDSIVIAHGTDTMCYTSAALSFMLQGIKIPVVLTGSNTPLETERSDAVTNMHDAIRVALDKRFKGVFLAFSGIDNQPSDIHLGCKARKVKFFDNCFKSVNVDIIGKIKKKILSKKLTVEIVNRQLFNYITKLNNEKDYQLKSHINDKISFFKVYPGFNPELIDYVIKKETKGLILELYNSGTGCIKNKYSLLESLKIAESKNIPVFVTSQQEGSVTMDSYFSSIEIKNSGAVPLRSMITEAAIPKLMWVLGQTSSPEEIKELMLTNICGEMEVNECF